tara:strand:+ start:609 stop:821 length:213 start_codon:yes stop_codon:yes gene_type:complete
MYSSLTTRGMDMSPTELQTLNAAVLELDKFVKIVGTRLKEQDKRDENIFQIIKTLQARLEILEKEVINPE